MNIVHYCIGTPDFRHGGASRYACDLALSQSKNNNVCLLFPGGVSVLGKKERICETKQWRGLNCYQLINPVIPPLLDGLKRAEYVFDSIRNVDIESINAFVSKEKPDVFHIHTLMGISLQFVRAIKEMGIKIVMTSHDYYGICPRVNLIDSNEDECRCSDGTYCESCNAGASSLIKLYIVNSPYFLHTKKYLKRFGITNRKTVSNSKKVLERKMCSQFVALRTLYGHIFRLIDIIHFNSNISEQMYRLHGIYNPGKVIPISLIDIADKRVIRDNINIDNIAISYVGGLNYKKGFPMLKDTLVQLYNNGYCNWTLNVWEGEKSYVDQDCPNIHYHGCFTRDMLADVFKKTDLLIVPSLCKETFGLTVMEAMQYGVPALVSTNVGAKMLVSKIDKELIFIDAANLSDTLKAILNNPLKLLAYNRELCKSNAINFSMEEHSEEILSLYKSN